MIGERTLILAEGYSADTHHGKTMYGLLRYRPEDVVAILDSERAGEAIHGVPVVGSVDEALALAPQVALVGVATQGGRFPPAWRALLARCLAEGLSIENGLHEFLRDDAELAPVAARTGAEGLSIENGLHEFLRDDAELAPVAARTGAEIRDLRRPPEGLSVPDGRNLALPTRNVLTVGSDCAIGKMTVSLELDREARRRGIASQFVPTGQTGIAIAGWGIAVDAVVADFIAGAGEELVVEGHERGGELLMVEGQGAISHPGYAGVTLGLLHGSAPHVLVLCHRAGTAEVNGYPGHPLLPLAELVDLYERLSLRLRPATVACVAVNTAGLGDDQAEAAIAAAAGETGLPADDVVRNGPGRLLDAVLAGPP